MSRRLLAALLILPLLGCAAPSGSPANTPAAPSAPQTTSPGMGAPGSSRPTCTRGAGTEAHPPEKRTTAAHTARLPTAEIIAHRKLRTRATAGRSLGGQVWGPRSGTRRAQSISATSSISTGVRNGNDETPTAERACRPASPKTSTRRSEQPLITFG